MTAAAVTVKETGAVFSREMNLAARDGKKTITRRIKGLQEINKTPDAWHFQGLNGNDDFLFYNTHARAAGHEPPDCMKVVKCPYSKVGDRLYIRETYAIKDTNESQTRPACWYAADFQHPTRAAKSMKFKWIGGIYMPKRAARTFLEIVGIRVERVQQISGAEAILEGVLHNIDFDFLAGYEHTKTEALSRFQKLWKELNGEES